MPVKAQRTVVRNVKVLKLIAFSPLSASQALEVQKVPQAILTLRAILVVQKIVQRVIKHWNGEIR